MDKKVQKKFDKFFESFEHKNDVVGILVCGSFVTGHPNKHSDLDVHLILNDTCQYRERGNRIVDGLLIEYFANTKRQILSYFEEDYNKVRPMSQTQFATGTILLDTDKTVLSLKNEAKTQLNKRFEGVDTDISPLTLYSIWDCVDDLQSLLEEKRQDFEFVFYNNLNSLLSIYFKHKKIPYNKKTILGHITSKITREKYLLEEIKDKDLVDQITICITNKDLTKKLKAYTQIAQRILTEYNFDIAHFSFKSPEDV